MLLLTPIVLIPPHTLLVFVVAHSGLVCRTPSVVQGLLIIVDPGPHLKII